MKDLTSCFRLMALVSLTFLLHSVASARSLQTSSGKSFDIAVRGVFDKITEKELTGAEYKLFDAETDSVITAGNAIRRLSDNGQIVERSFFRIKEIPFDGRYRLSVSFPDYEDSITEIDGRSLDTKQYTLFIDNLFLNRKSHELDEVTVRATKVKFYHRGDTLVYNADTFVVAEGSMLDDIIRQLPGVELKDNGQILVNGRFVESLLLNGKDFFKGKRELMLKNLAAYTVKDIEIYERQSDIDRLLGSDFGKKHLTMDVKLKRGYNHNYMGNFEAGVGTKNRYLGRLFTMLNSDHARISLIGNLNNLNETRRPGMEQTFTPEGIPSGTLKTYMGGMEYNVDNKKAGWQVNGDVVVKRTVLDDGTRSYTTNFLPSGDTYGRTFSSKTNRDFKVSTSHQFQTSGKWHFIGIHPSFEYSKGNYRNSLERAVFDADIQNVTSEMIHNIFNGAHPLAAEALINRELKEKLDKGHELKAGLWSNGRFRMKTGMLQTLSYLVSISYDKAHYDGFDNFTINFGNKSQFTEASDRYLRNYPDYTYNVKSAAGYQARPSRNIALDIYYEYSYSESKATSGLYTLAQLTEGTLPSYREYLHTFDPSLSYVNRQSENLHTLSPTVMGRLGLVEFRIKGDVCIESQGIDYFRDDISHNLSRTLFRPGNMEVAMKFPLDKAGKFTSQFDYSLTPKSPDLVNMIDIVDRRDPLNIFIGNADLRNSIAHRFRWTAVNNNHQSGVAQYYALAANIYRNLLSVAYDYDTTTGVKTSWMQNVNGNWDATVTQELHLEPKAIRRFFFENVTRLSYTHSVDFLSENGSSALRNSINIYTIGEELKLGYNNAGNKAEIFWKGDLQHFGSVMTDFKPFNAGNYNYGLRGIIKLPANFQIATDFTVYSRRGYNDHQLNTDNFVWNARVSYSIPKAGLTLMADGFDILHNLSDVSYGVNAQARTETYYTVLPRYFLFHIQWTFNKKPNRDTGR